MPKLFELEPEAFAKAQERRRVRIKALEKAGYVRWDMTPEGDERFCNLKNDVIKTVQFDPETGEYRIV